nr:MAG TPA: SERINE PROTEINASE B COMPLEX WITH(SERINE PROTEINASE-INHIBITOR) [Caudoviricetes sp.]
MFRLEVTFCKYYNADGNFFQANLKGDLICSYRKQ